MLEVQGTTIHLTRGDTAEFEIAALGYDGKPYEFQEGDAVRFRLTRKWDDRNAIVERAVPTTTMLLKIVPSDTSELRFGDYKYDVQLTTAGGDVFTFIKGDFRVTEETDHATIT